MAQNVSLKELCDKLGVGHPLSAYETFPWSAFAPDKGITASAEVRMGGDSEEIEAEAQLMYDTPPAGKPPMEQVCYIRATAAGDRWTVVTLRVRGKPYGADISNWQNKSCIFFSLLVSSLKTDEIPDVDDCLEEAFYGKDRLGGGGGGGGGKSPKIKAGQVLGIKRGR